MDKENVIVCAPMVRVSNISFRLLAAQYGADVVYSEELIAQKLVKTKRVIDGDIVKYILTEQKGKLKHKKLLQTVVFSTLQKTESNPHPEGAPVVLQLGTNSPEHAVAAALHMQQDVDGIDLNMGCPKDFSIKGGMGAALLSEPDKACSILKALKENVSIPVSCKIRMLEDKTEMLSLLTKLIATGVHHITIHARFKPDRPADPPRYEYLIEVLKDLYESGSRIPIYLNGDLWGLSECADIFSKQLPNVKGCMIARGAFYNPSCFCKEPVPKIEIFSTYLKYCLKYGNGMRDVKYALTRSFCEESAKKTFKTVFDKMQLAKSIPDMWEALGNDPNDVEFTKLHNEYKDPIASIDGTMEEYEKRSREEAETDQHTKRMKTD
eukprot:TRINITY_DN4606_c0_g1_i1.p1 TRINITY_DN4606_c0_g1~~TRINITY_DN4606_c0_g1_i1.p1  ORF type:complete len:380 (+),score=79.08 TRINITY_DN4606_c0_g1_i1:45-1184(+)